MFILPLANFPKRQVTSSPGWQGPINPLIPRQLDLRAAYFAQKSELGKSHHFQPVRRQKTSAIVKPDLDEAVQASLELKPP
jgi:hypothetical protein